MLPAMVLTTVKAPNRRARAFSMIEVIIAAALLGLGVAGILSAYSTATNLDNHQHRVSSALHVGESVVEELLLLQQIDADLTAGSHGPRGYDVDGNRLAGAGFYAVNWVISPGPHARARRIEVRVTWSDRIGPSQSLTLVTHRS